MLRYSTYLSDRYVGNKCSFIPGERCFCTNKANCYLCKELDRSVCQYFPREYRQWVSLGTNKHCIIKYHSGSSSAKYGTWQYYSGLPVPRCESRELNYYSIHYACFDCRIGWKGNDTRPYFGCKMAKEDDGRPKFINYNNPRCKKCGKDGMPMGKNFRVPKQKDKKAWEMVKFITHDLEGILIKLGDLEEEEPSFLKNYCLKKYDTLPTLAKLFIKLNFKFQTNHIFRPLGNQLRLSYPKHKRDIPEFIHTLRSTILHDYNPWYILRKYIQMRAIARYWRKLGRLHRIKDNAAYTIMYAWHQYSFSTPGSYHYEQGVKEFEEFAGDAGWN